MLCGPSVGDYSSMRFTHNIGFSLDKLVREDDMILDFVLQTSLVIAIVMLMLPLYEWACSKSGFHIACGWILGFILYHWWKSITGEINYYSVIPGCGLALVLHDQLKILWLRLTWRGDE